MLLASDDLFSSFSTLDLNEIMQKSSRQGTEEPRPPPCGLGEKRLFYRLQGPVFKLSSGTHQLTQSLWAPFSYL